MMTILWVVFFGIVALVLLAAYYSNTTPKHPG
jgi:hypothetical protein